jgi:sugar phosphate isomerase/epimerase
MRLGCHVSALQQVRKAPYEEAIENAGLLGFDGVELIAMDQSELNEYYTASKIKELRLAGQRHGLTISQFAVYSTACEGMASLEPSEREKGIEVFRQGIDICKELGCDIINLVSHWPVGMRGPIEYIPSYIYPIARGGTRIPSPKFTMSLPEPFDFDEIWQNYTQSLSIVSEMAREQGIKFAIEGHAHVIVSGTDAMLRLFDQVNDPSLVVNFDTSWHFIQREYLPMSILKLKNRIAHVHVRDADGLLFYGAPPGQGIIDWLGVVRALSDVGYDGFLSFEWSGYDDYLSIAREAKNYMTRILQEPTDTVRNAAQ